MKNKYINKVIKVAVILLVALIPILSFGVARSIPQINETELFIRSSLYLEITAFVAIPHILILGSVLSYFSKKIGKQYIWSIAGYLLVSIFTVFSMYTPFGASFYLFTDWTRYGLVYVFTFLFLLGYLALSKKKSLLAG